MPHNDVSAARLDAIKNYVNASRYDVAVVGLGALGSAAAYHAAKKGASVIAFEQYEFGHVRGASHDTSRIVRTSYELPEYVALAKSAYNDWADLEAASKQKLLTITGGIMILPKDMEGQPSASQWARGLEANNVPYELLDARQANKRWPQFNIKDDMEVIYTNDTGIAHAAKSVAAMQFLARFHGADLKEHIKVERIGSHGSGVSIETSKGRFSASKVVLAADAWTNQLLKPLGLEIPLAITQEQVTYFKPTNPADFQSDRFPVWILVGDQWYYGFPCFGEPAIKCSHDNTKLYTTPEDRSFVPSARIFEELSSAMQELMPDSDRKPLRTITCQYTMTPDRQFVITPLAQHKDIIVTLGAAHAFKFAPTIGRVAAELALDGYTKEDISKFGFPTPESLANPLRSRIAG